ncbi:matrixin family metalloprotease [Streptomyces yaizuensis]|uniref:Matrixin family metalloprotease n=1 Tax=Streptomyces yaizuensis TaxID=2989713 RepID=A0ABQ5NY69_9ACTN|nr:matrixin family metalloprotease [Streptomyces sp. YSPA8]GLF95167.1 matrixin family metalloprotease [Streptomyces sp. YSPA8]
MAAVEVKDAHLGAVGRLDARGGCGVEVGDPLVLNDEEALADGQVAAQRQCGDLHPQAGVIAVDADDLREADVRYNTADSLFTDRPTGSCRNRYDIRSVGTHEAGHVFGLGHVGAGHENLTMYTNSFLCTTKARTLGKGDVLALRSIY